MRPSKKTNSISTHRKYKLAYLSNCFFDLSTKWKLLGIASFFILSSADKAFCFDTMPIKEDSDRSIEVSSKVDLTKLPLGETFKVRHPKFTLQYFFNNRDVFGFILRRQPSFGIVVHLCFFRSCEESPFDINELIAMPQDPQKERAFFSVRLPHGLQYEFQGMEFLPVR